MKHKTLLITLLMLFAISAFAQIPQTMSYQGVLTDANGTPVADGPVDLTFKLYDAATDGALLWEETQEVDVAKGLFNVILGTSNPLNLPFDKPYWLGSTIGTDAELQPRTALTSSPYSLNSQTAGGNGDGHSLDAVDGDPVDAVFVDAEGNVGVGTTSPQSKLHVAGLLSLGAEGDNSVVRFETASGKTATIGVQDDGDEGFFVYTNDAYRLNVRQNGNVGIGTQTPAEKLEVAGNVHASGTIQSGNSVTLDGANDKITASSGTISFDDEDLVTSGTIETTSGGFKFPDGTTQTTATLQGDPGLACWDTNGNGMGDPEEDINNDGNFDALDCQGPKGDQGEPGADGHSLDAPDGGPSDALLVDETGNVGIGVTEPTEALDVEGNIKSSGKVLASAYSSNSPLIFEAPAGTERARIDDITGNFGIGTTSPAVPLHIATGSDVTGTSGGRLLLGSARGSGLRMDGNEIQAFTSGTSEDATLFLQHEGDGNVDLVDKTLYVKSDGTVGIGTTSPQFLLHVNGSAGKPGGGSWSSASDARLKDIKGHFTRGLDTIDKLNPVYYSYKKDNPINLPSDEKYIGLIAQQVQKVIPEAVGEYEDGYLSVNNDPIIWTMLNAIKELKAENKATREELSQTKAELNDLKTKVNKLESQFSQTAMLNRFLAYASK